MSSVEDAPVVHISTSGRKANYKDIIGHIEAVEKLGNWIWRSQMFGCQTEGQGCVIATEIILSGQHPIEYCKRNKIVANKPFKQYDTMLAELHERGGKSQVIESTPEIAKMRFVYGDKDETRSLTWQELQKEPVVYKGKEDDVVAALERGETPVLKPKYATPLSRKTMLIARLVSSAIRTICPEICYGVYTPEEIEDFADEPTVAVSPVADKQEAKPKRESRTREEDPTPEVKAEEVKAEDPAKEAAPVVAATEPASVSLNEPATSMLVDRIKQLIAEVYEGGDTEIKNKIKAKLAASKLSGLADLSIAEAELLVSSLTSRAANLWLDASLTGHASAPK
jgi:hypothetical protein